MSDWIPPSVVALGGRSLNLELLGPVPPFRHIDEWDFLPPTPSPAPMFFRRESRSCESFTDIRKNQGRQIQQHLQDYDAPTVVHMNQVSPDHVALLLSSCSPRVTPDFVLADFRTGIGSTASFLPDSADSEESFDHENFTIRAVCSGANSKVPRDWYIAMACPVSSDSSCFASRRRFLTAGGELILWAISEEEEEGTGSSLGTARIVARNRSTDFSFFWTSEMTWCNWAAYVGFEEWYVHDLETLKAVHSVIGQDGNMSCCVPNERRKILAVSGERGTVLWDARTGGDRCPTMCDDDAFQAGRSGSSQVYMFLDENRLLTNTLPFRFDDDDDEIDSCHSWYVWDLRKLSTGPALTIPLLLPTNVSSVDHIQPPKRWDSFVRIRENPDMFVGLSRPVQKKRTGKHMTKTDSSYLLTVDLKGKVKVVEDDGEGIGKIDPPLDPFQSTGGLQQRLLCGLDGGKDGMGACASGGDVMRQFEEEMGDRIAFLLDREELFPSAIVKVRFLDSSTIKLWGLCVCAMEKD